MVADYSKHKNVMRAIGIPLLVIGIILLIYGFTSCIGGNFNNAFRNMMIFAGGGF